MPNDQLEAHEYLTLRLAEQVYAVPIAQVHEIRQLGTVTRMPEWPGWALGVMNLRGSVVAVVDLRLRMDTCAPVYGVQTALVIASQGAGSIGFVVDCVEDVIHVQPSSIEPLPAVGGGGLGDRCATHVAKIGESLVTLLDLTPLFAEVGRIQSVADECDLPDPSGA